MAPDSQAAYQALVTQGAALHGADLDTARAQHLGAQTLAQSRHLRLERQREALLRQQLEQERQRLEQQQVSNQQLQAMHQALQQREQALIVHESDCVTRTEAARAQVDAVTQRWAILVESTKQTATAVGTRTNVVLEQRETALGTAGIEGSQTGTTIAARALSPATPCPFLSCLGQELACYWATENEYKQVCFYFL